MRFGLFGGAVAGGAAPDGAARRRASASDDSHGYRQLTDTVCEADRLGYHAVFLVEHHFTGTAQLSATLNVLSFLAAHTARIRLGTAVLVLPWHDPVLLAEQVATLDVLSGGRVDLGVGRGYRPAEFAHFDLAPADAAERFDEALGLLRRALVSGERFSHRGRHWRFNDIVVEPAPVQQPHPPMWLAAGRDESIRAAANGGLRLLIDQFANVEVVARRLAVYRDALTARRADFDPYHVAVARGLAIVRSGAERRAAVAARAAVLERMNRLGADASGRQTSSMASDPDTAAAAENGTLIGTPDEIVDRLGRLYEAGVRYVLLSGVLADVAQLRCFQEEIVPQLPGAARAAVAAPHT